MIYVNGKFIIQKISGVQRFANEILKEIDVQLSNQNQPKLTLVIPKNAPKNIHYKNIKIHRSFFNYSFFWEQFYLPIFTYNRILLNLTGSAPIIKVKQFITIHDAVIFDKPDAYSFLFTKWYSILFKFQKLQLIYSIILDLILFTPKLSII